MQGVRGDGPFAAGFGGAGRGPGEAEARRGRRLARLVPSYTRAMCSASYLLTLPLLALALAGCDGDVDAAPGAGGGSSSSTTTSTSGSGGGGPAGDCQSDADCGGAPCAPLTPGGYRVCLSFPSEVTECPGGGPPDLCCSSADCQSAGGGTCYFAADLQFCGGAYPDYNVCVPDGCQSDEDCAMGQNPAICAPAGAFGNPARACLVAYCRVDADCTAKPGGACRLVGGDPCCSHPAPDGLACVYPGGCLTDADCPGGACDIGADGVSVCGPEGPGCPP